MLKHVQRDDLALLPLPQDRDKLFWVLAAIVEEQRHSHLLVVATLYG